MDICKKSFLTGKTIPELESIRGLLSIWVVFSHLMIPFTFKLNGGAAVSVFMILSGFVISSLITNLRESYGLYILRRFLRLFPLFIVTFLLSVVFVDFFIETINAYPWKGAKETARLLFFQESSENTFKHILAHLTMLHGIISDKLLPYAAYAFLGPAWSISLEWQFYLLAPIIISFYRSSYAFISMLIIFFLIDEYFLMGYPFLPESIQFFIIGIATFFYVSGNNGSEMENYARLFVLLLFVYIQCRHDLFQLIPCAFWLLAIKVIFYSKQKGIFKYFKLILNTWVARFLGKISYSIYLIHMPIIFLCSYICVSFGLNTDRIIYTIVYIPLLLTLTLLLSYLTYSYIELPFINLGKKLTIYKKNIGGSKEL